MTSVSNCSCQRALAEQRVFLPSTSRKIYWCRGARTTQYSDFEAMCRSEYQGMARVSSHLALLYQYQKSGKYDEAESLYQRVLIGNMSGPEHPDTATSSNNLAALYDNQRKDKAAQSRMAKLYR